VYLQPDTRMQNVDIRLDQIEKDNNDFEINEGSN